MTKNKDNIITVNKDNIIAAVSKRTGATKQDSAEMVNAMLEYIAESLASGNSIAIRGFGSLECKVRKERTAHSPKTGEPIQVPKRRAVVFRAGKRLKDCVAGPC